MWSEDDKSPVWELLRMFIMQWLHISSRSIVFVVSQSSLWTGLALLTVLVCMALVWNYAQTSQVPSGMLPWSCTRGVHSHGPTLFFKRNTTFLNPFLPVTLTPGHVHFVKVHRSTLFPKRNATFHAAFFWRRVYCCSAKNRWLKGLFFFSPYTYSVPVKILLKKIYPNIKIKKRKTLLYSQMKNFPASLFHPASAVNGMCVYVRACIHASVSQLSRLNRLTVGPKKLV